MMCPRLRNAAALRSWKRNRTDPTLQASRRNRPWKQLTLAPETQFKLLASGTVRELISVFLSQQVCDNLSPKPWGTDTWGNCLHSSLTHLTHLDVVQIREQLINN